MDFESILNFELWGNDGQNYATALAIFVGLLILFKIFSVIVLARLKKASKKTNTDVDDFIIDLVRHVKPPFYFMVALYIAVQFLSLGDFIGKIIFGVFVIVLVIQIIVTLQKVVDYVILKKFLKPSEDESDRDREGIVKLSGQLVKGALWVFGGLLILSNLGVNVTSLIAGLGIGGIAIALAVKDILGDIFASFSIFVDKPFKVGDFIELSPNEKGTVEKIGIQTTRFITRQGQELIVPNKKLVDAVLQNHRRIEKRRTVFSIGVVYGTSKEKLEKIPKILKRIIEVKNEVKFERTHLSELADSSLNFEISYLLNNPSLEIDRNIKHEIFMEIISEFEKEGIEFAYPTQTVFVQKKA